MTAGRRAMSWLLEPSARPRSRREVTVLGAIQVMALIVAAQTIWKASKPLIKAPPVPEVPADKPGERFGIKDQVRRDIFAEYAAADPQHRLNGKTSFPTETWSAEDHRAAFERQLSASLASKYNLTLTQVYLVLDEGIHEQWPGPDGKPISPFTVPLKPRRKY